MKNIQFNYNPYRIHTTMSVNGEIIPDDDIYSIIYSVHSYPISCWLEKRGSWPGLMFKLKILSRGEDLELCFKGRKLDFDDFQKALYGFTWQQRVSIIHMEEYENKVYLQKYSNIKEGILKIWDNEYPAIDKGTQTLVDQINKKTALLSSKKEPLALINSLQDDTARNILRKSAFGCVINSRTVKNIEDVNMIFQMGRTMVRPGDSIICCIKDSDMGKLVPDTFLEEKNNIKIINADDAQCLEEAKREVYFKYSEPLLIYGDVLTIKEILSNYHMILNQLMDLKEDRKKVCKILNSSTSLHPSAEDENDYNDILLCIDWILKNEDLIKNLDKDIEKIWG